MRSPSRSRWSMGSPQDRQDFVPGVDRHDHREAALEEALFEAMALPLACLHLLPRLHEPLLVGLVVESPVTQVVSAASAGSCDTHPRSETAPGRAVPSPRPVQPPSPAGTPRVPRRTGRGDRVAEQVGGGLVPVPPAEVARRERDERGDVPPAVSPRYGDVMRRAMSRRERCVTSPPTVVPSTSIWILSDMTARPGTGLAPRGSLAGRR